MRSFGLLSVSLVLAVAFVLACGRSEPAPAHARAPARATNAPLSTPLSGSVSNAEEVVAAMRPQFGECYQIGLWNNREQSGSVRLVVDVDARGRAAVVTPAGGTGLDRMVINCLVGVARRSAFAPPTGGSARVVIPINLGMNREADGIVGGRTSPADAGAPDADPVSRPHGARRALDRIDF